MTCFLCNTISRQSCKVKDGGPAIMASEHERQIMSKGTMARPRCYVNKYSFGGSAPRRDRQV